MPSFFNMTGREKRQGRHGRIEGRKEDRDGWWYAKLGRLSPVDSAMVSELSLLTRVQPVPKAANLIIEDAQSSQGQKKKKSRR